MAKKKMKKTTKELLFERMHTIGGMPIKEEIKKPTLGVEFKEGEKFKYLHHPVTDISEDKKEVILTNILPIIQDSIRPDFNDAFEKEIQMYKNITPSDDEFQRRAQFANINNQQSHHEDFNKFSNEVYTMLNDGIGYSVIFEKSHADQNQIVPIEYVSNLHSTLKNIADKYNFDASNLIIDVARNLERNFVEIKN